MRSGLGVRTRGEGRGTRRSALDSDKWGRWRPWAAALGRGRRDSMQGKTIADRAGATLWGGWVVWWTGQAPSVPSGRQWPRNRAMARVNWVSQGQPCGRCKVRRRAERVSRPAREKKRRRRVLVVTTPSSRPMRAGGPGYGPAPGRPAMRRWPGKRPEGRWLRPTPCLRSRMAFSTSAWRRWSASSSRVSPSRSVMKP